MLPDFGCGIHDLVHETNTSVLRAQVHVLVKDALAKWEPRINVKEITVVSAEKGSGNFITISIAYEIRSTNTHHNLIYPFFLSEDA